MNKSTRVFALHCVCLFSLTGCSLASYEIKRLAPEFFAQEFFPIFIAMSILTLISWPLFKGCPLTKWENRLRKLENKTPFEGSWMVHYYHKLTGKHINTTLFHVLLIGIMLIPVYVRFFVK